MLQDPTSKTCRIIDIAVSSLFGWILFLPCIVSHMIKLDIKCWCFRICIGSEKSDIMFPIKSLCHKLLVSVLHDSGRQPVKSLSEYAYLHYSMSCSVVFSSHISYCYFCPEFWKPVFVQIFHISIKNCKKLWASSNAIVQLDQFIVSYCQFCCNNMKSALVWNEKILRLFLFVIIIITK